MRKLMMTIGMMALVGCVSIKTLDQDLKSSDATKKSVAQKNLVEIVTKGRVGLVTFSTEDRLWCAKNITIKADIENVIQTMAIEYGDRQASEEVQNAIAGMACDKNASIVEVLLKNLGANSKIANRLLEGNIAYARNVSPVVKKYIEAYIQSINDIETLISLKEKLHKSLKEHHKNFELRWEVYDKVIPARIIAVVSTIDDLKKVFEEGSLGDDEKRQAIAKIKNQDDLFAILKEYKNGSVRYLIREKITKPELVEAIALEEDASEEELEKITDKPTLVRIALLTKSQRISWNAKNKIGDAKAIAEGIAELLKQDKISEDNVVKHVEALSDNEATITLYNAAKSKQLKQTIFRKLSPADRKVVREANIANCKKLIDSAKDKSKESFELGGFYLGMNIEDVDMLIGYYFPEWAISEKVDSDDKDIRVVYVPQQSRPFCRANKDGKVWQLNFGKSILKKFFNYDVQNEEEWARAYSKQHNINLKYVYLQKDTTVNIPQADLSLQQYNAHLYQETWQWKNNAKGYRVTYFAEPKVVSMYNNIIEQQALYQFRFISSDAGTLRVTIDNN